MNASLDIVIVNWNSGAQLGACLESIAAVRDEVPLRRVIVVDNASTDGSASTTGGAGLPLVLVRNDTNRGFAAACNQGAAHGDADFVLFLNPDTIVHPGSLRRPLEFMSEPRNARVGICGIQLLDQGDAIARSCSRFPTTTMFLLKALGLETWFPASWARQPMTEWDHESSRAVDQVIGAFFLVRRSLFLDLAGFDERFFVYFEEVDFSHRAAMRGFGSYYLADARAFHVGGGCTGQIKAQRLVYEIRSRIEYGLKHYSRWSALMLLFTSLVIEPCSRSAAALARRSLSDCNNVIRAYRQLWMVAPRLLGRVLR